MGVRALSAAQPADGMLLGGVVPATGARLIGAVAIDALLWVGLVLAALLAGASPHTRDAVAALGALVVLYTAGQVATLALHGRSVGRILLGIRTVERSTASPVGARRTLALLVLAPLQPRFISAHLRWGRDPLERAFQPVAADTIRAAPLRQRAQPAASAASPLTIGNVAERRPHALIDLDSGEQLALHDALFIGRAPRHPAGRSSGALYAWADLSRTISKTHALVEWTGTAVQVTDLGSTNGTACAASGTASLSLLPFHPTLLPDDAQVQLGDRTLRIQTIERGDEDDA